MWDAAANSMSYGGETGKPVAPDFEYASNTNDRWFNVEQLRAVIG
jgi:hypothetical protein